MEWNGMETDMAHMDLVTLWSTGRSDRVSTSLDDDDDDDVILPFYPNRHTRTFVPCLHTSSAACYTALCRLTVDDTVFGDRLARPPPGLDTHAWMLLRGCGCDLGGNLQLLLVLDSGYTGTSSEYWIGPTATNVNWDIKHGPHNLQLDLLLACADTDTAGPNRAHDRPPSRTTKTATLYTNPATSWQIDVREYVNTLIVVDLSKPQID